MGKISKSSGGNRTPGSSDSRWGTREEYKTVSRKMRRDEAKKEIRLAKEGT